MKRENIIGASQGSKLALERAQSEISLLLCHQSGCRWDFIECTLSVISALGRMSKNSHLRDLPRRRLSSRCGIDDGAKEGRYNQVAAFFGKHL